MTGTCSDRLVVSRTTTYWTRCCWCCLRPKYRPLNRAQPHVLNWWKTQVSFQEGLRSGIVPPAPEDLYTKLTTIMDDPNRRPGGACRTMFRRPNACFWSRMCVRVISSALLHLKLPYSLQPPSIRIGGFGGLFSDRWSSPHLEMTMHQISNAFIHQP